MSDFFGSVWWFLVTIGLLVTFHEFGHFWVARRCGVKVLRFSVGFGKPLFSRQGKDGTEYVIAAIPLGGYVKMLDSREAEVPANELHQDFNSKPLAQRMAIVAAGPIFNLIFTVVAFWIMFMVGKPDFLPIIDAPTKLAQEAGLKAGDQLLSIDGKPIDSWSKAVLSLAENAIAQKDVPVTIRETNGKEVAHTLKLSQVPISAQGAKLFEHVGLKLKPPESSSIVGGVIKNRPAQQAGMLAGDKILAINGFSVTSFQQVNDLIQQEAAKNPILSVQIQRDGNIQSLSIKAEQLKNEKTKESAPARWLIGISATDPHNALLRYNPIAAIPAAFGETWDATASTLRLLKLMVTGQASTQNVSGLLSMGQYANDSAKMGLAWFLNFLAMVSVGLAIMNFLPIPVLDGGHLMYGFIEWIKGSPVSERILIAGQYVGLVLIVSLMGLAFYNDILRLFGS